MKKFAASALFLAFVSLTAHAQSLPVDPDARLSLGVNVGYTASAYKADNTVGFAPQGFYDNHRWYIEGGELGFYPYKDSKHHARIGVGYDGRSFDPDDADDEILCPECGYSLARNDEKEELRPKHCPECGTKLIY